MSTDWGKGQPIVFSHGWPLTANALEDQMFFLAPNGYRALLTTVEITAVRVSHRVDRGGRFT